MLLLLPPFRQKNLFIIFANVEKNYKLRVSGNAHLEEIQLAFSNIIFFSEFTYYGNKEKYEIACKEIYRHY